MSVFQGPGTSATRCPSLSLQVPKVQTDRPPQSPPGCRAPSPPSNPSTPPASSPLRRQNPGSFVFSRELTSLSAVPPLSLLFSSFHRLELKHPLSLLFRLHLVVIISASRFLLQSSSQSPISTSLSQPASVVSELFPADPRIVQSGQVVAIAIAIASLRP